MRFVLSAIIGLLWTMQAQTQELDSPDLLSTANIRRVEGAAEVTQVPVQQKQPPQEQVSQPQPQVAQIPPAKASAAPVVTANPKPKPAPTPTPAVQPAPAPGAPPANPGPQVNSSVSLQDFAWGADSRYRIQLTHDGKGLQFRGDLRANTKTEFTKDRLTIGLRHYPQDFLIITIAVDNDEYAHVFLIEASGSSQQGSPFRILNSRSIRARKAGVVDEIEAMIVAFKKVSGFDTAQSMRKMADYFAQNPSKKAHDLFDAVEREEPFVKTLAKPRGSSGATDQGVVTPEMPSQVAQSPAPVKQPGDALDLRPTTAPPSPDDDFQDPQQQAWLRQQRARLQAERNRQGQRQIVGYDQYGRPMYANQQPGYGQGQMQYDPNTGGYYRRQYQSQPPGYPQQQPGYYRQNPIY